MAFSARISNRFWSPTGQKDEPVDQAPRQKTKINTNQQPGVYGTRGYENQLVRQLQLMLGYHTTRSRVTPHRAPQGNSTPYQSTSKLLRAQCTPFIATLSSQRIWASLLPFAQQAYNMLCSATTDETPYCLVFGRQARLPVDIILGLPYLGFDLDTHEFSRQTQKNLQLEFELARRNMIERTEH